MATEEFTEEELSMLSDAERAALLDEEDGDDAEDEDGTAKPDAAAANPDEEDEDGDGDQDDEDKAKPDAEKEAGAGADKDKPDAEADVAAEAAKKAEASTAPTVVEPGPDEDEVDFGDGFVSLMKINGNSEQLKTDIETAEQEKATLKKQYDDGELDLDAYLEKREALTSKISDFKADLRNEERAIEHNRHAHEQRWQYEQDRFFESATGKVIAENPMLLAAFDTAVKTLGGDEKNNSQSGPWFLKEAAKQVRALAPGLFPGAPKEEGKKDIEAKPDKKATAAGKKPDLSTIPPNLGDLPTAAEDDAGGDDEFAYLEKLKGVDYEDALAKLEKDPAKYQRFLEAA